MHIPDDELAAIPTGRNYTCDMTPFSPDCLPYMVQNNRSMHTWLFDVSHAYPLETPILPPILPAPSLRDFDDRGRVDSSVRTLPA